MDKQGERLKLIASSDSWIEGEAVRQLKNSLNLPGMEFVVGLPDLHPGKGNPVGAAFVSRGRLFPFLVGSDIGCGIGLWETSLMRGKIKRDRWVKRLSGLDAPWSGELSAWFESHNLEMKGWESSMGTIGGGNHFAELQLIESVVDEGAFRTLGLDGEKLFLTVHSGSRGLGEATLRRHVDGFAAKGVDEGTEEATRYLTEHDYAVRWAIGNRELIAQRFLEALSADGRRVIDLCHNSVVRVSDWGEPRWLHRKGAAPSNQGPAIIPGSRGAFTYLVIPTGDQSANAFSIAHGAGRKWGRGAIKDRLKGKVSPASLIRTKLGGLVICDDKDLLFEEAPEAYKDVGTVVEDLKNAGLIEVVAILRPIITYKTSRDGE